MKFQPHTECLKGGGGRVRGGGECGGERSARPTSAQTEPNADEITDQQHGNHKVKTTNRQQLTKWTDYGRIIHLEESTSAN